jgi:hypothetical protein
VLLVVCILSTGAPAVAAAQGRDGGFTVQGAAGTHLNGGGDHQSVSVGFSPNGHLDFLISAERSHLPTEVTPFGATRGGTATFFSGEVRVAPFTFNRLSPYVLASAGRGTSRPNVNDLFPDRVTNDTWLLFFGGGLRIPMTTRLSAFADVRAGIQGERDTIGLLVPVRGGLAWRF